MGTTFHYIEPVPILDNFINGIASIDRAGGGCLRYTFYCEQNCIHTGVPERVIVARHIFPVDSLKMMQYQTITALMEHSRQSATLHH